MKGWPPHDATSRIVPLARGLKTAVMPFVSGAAVPSNRACRIVTDGKRARKVRVTSATGVSMSTPFSLTTPEVIATGVLPVSVPLDVSLHVGAEVPRWRHIWAAPNGLVTLIAAVTSNAPALANERVRVSPAGSDLASSFSPTNVIEALGGGVGAGVGDGDADGTADGDPPGPDGLAPGLTGPLSPGLALGVASARLDPDGEAVGAALLPPRRRAPVTPPSRARMTAR